MITFAGRTRGPQPTFGADEHCIARTLDIGGGDLLQSTPLEEVVDRGPPAFPCTHAGNVPGGSDRIR